MTWMGALRIATRGIAFVKIVVLARILAPAQFGLFGIASLVLAFLKNRVIKGAERTIKAAIKKPLIIETIQAVSR